MADETLFCKVDWLGRRGQFETFSGLIWDEVNRDHSCREPGYDRATEDKVDNIVRVLLAFAASLPSEQAAKVAEALGWAVDDDP